MKAALLAIFLCSCESVTYVGASGERFHMMTLAGKSATASVELPSGFKVKGHRADNSTVVKETKSGILLGKTIERVSGWVDQLIN